jgi:hypothetical protein
MGDLRALHQDAFYNARNFQTFDSGMALLDGAAAARPTEGEKEEFHGHFGYL